MKMKYQYEKQETRSDISVTDLNRGKETVREREDS